MIDQSSLLLFCLIGLQYKAGLARPASSKTSRMVAAAISCAGRGRVKIRIRVRVRVRVKR